MRILRLVVAMSLLGAGALGARAQQPGEVPETPPADGGASAETGPRTVVRIELDGAVIPGSADYILSALAHAVDQEAAALLMVLDTPGGSLDSTRQIVRGFLGAEVPVVVYVSPAGAHAASAGMFLTIAGHVAGMAPGTNIGAAHPVTAGGGDVEDQAGEDMATKVENDTAALARTIAQRRGRNVEWAENAVRESVSATAEEAVELGVVDLVAVSETDLLQEIDGRKVKLEDREVVLRTRGARIERFEMTISQRVVAFLGDPNVATILGMLGILGILMELYNPGLIVPGTIGVLSFLLAAIGYSILPVNVGAIVLFVVAVALFAAEIKFTSFGLLTVAAIAALALGAALLIDTSDPEFYIDPSFRVSWGVIVPTAVLMGSAAFALMLFVVRLQRQRSSTGVEGLVGEEGRARTEVGPGGGRVFVHGELWSAVSRSTIPAGASVVVTEVEGLRLTVAERRSA